MIDPELLAALRCPATGERLLLAPEEVERRLREAGLLEEGDRLLVGEQGRSAYRVRGGIPVLLPEERIDLGSATQQSRGGTGKRRKEWLTDGAGGCRGTGRPLDQS